MSSIYAELPFEQLANLYREFGPGPWSATKTRVHDEIARRVHAHGMIRLGVRTYRPTEDGSFAIAVEPHGHGVTMPRLGRAAELVQSLDPAHRRVG